MKNTLLLILVLFAAIASKAQSKDDPVLEELNNAVNNKQQYVHEKELRITSLKKVRSGATSLLQEYQINKSLHDEYKKFKLDSAIRYVTRNVEIAGLLKRNDLSDAAKIQLATLFSFTGKYRESEQILGGINKQHLTKEQLTPYFEAYFRFFEHYATNSNSYWETYIRKIRNYRDSLTAVSDPSSLSYKIHSEEKNIENGQLDSSEKKLLELLQVTKHDNPDYAMVAYLLGNIYQLKQNDVLAKKYFAISATADIRNAVKDQASIQVLSQIYYKEGNIDEAYKLVKSAIEDAVFCNVQFRTTQLSAFYTIINTAYLDKEAERKSQLKVYLFSISVLSVFLLMAIAYVYKQMKKVSRIKEELFATNEKLAQLNKEITCANEQLNERNAELSESNHIKEEYIAHFFDLCSTYINKLEGYRKELNKKVSDKKLEELFKMLKSTTVVDNELEELYSNFDTIFLNLYPTFVKDFNSLLIADEQVILKQGELLNTELRIFALIRLGITDSVKIAAFLRYSLSTIYNYRTKARNKAIVSRDEFEKMVMRIGSIPAKVN
ncbi:hypothetical protein D3C80_373860 [compost metagenome]